MKIKMNSFACRHLLYDSPYSHIEPAPPGIPLKEGQALCDATEQSINTHGGLKSLETPGRPGVYEVPIAVEGFQSPDRPWRIMSAVREIEEGDELVAEFSARREGEDPYVSVKARGKKQPAKKAVVILYSREALGDEATHEDSTHEIVSLNARVTVEPEPPTPMAMARNFLDLPGGTKAEYTAEEFAKAIAYWSSRAMILSKE